MWKSGSIYPLSLSFIFFVLFYFILFVGCSYSWVLECLDVKEIVNYSNFRNASVFLKSCLFV